MSCGPNQPKRIEVVNVPGISGNPGAPGINGQNAYTVTTADLVIPAVDGNVVVSVLSSLWMAVGLPVFISDGTSVGSFTVVSFPTAASVSLTFNGYNGDSAPGATISAGAAVVASGQQGPAVATPISIANGGTGANTKAAAQAALGLGQNAQTSSQAGLTQTITASYVQVGTVGVTIPAAGQYLLLASITVLWSGVTFGSSRNISFKIRNTTQNIDVVSATKPTGTATTATSPTSDFVIPFTLSNSANTGDNLALMVIIDVVNSAGTLEVIAGSLCAVPLSLS
jgi:hypothetical protein